MQQHQIEEKVAKVLQSEMLHHTLLSFMSDIAFNSDLLYAHQRA